MAVDGSEVFQAELLKEDGRPQHAFGCFLGATDNLDCGLTAEALDESHPKTVALLRGPVLYAGLDSTGTGSTGLDSAAAAAVEPPRLTPGGLVPAGGTGDTYVQSLNEQRTVFVPFYRVQNESYNLYLQQT